MSEVTVKSEQYKQWYRLLQMWLHLKQTIPGHMKHHCPMNLNRTAAMYKMNDQEAAMSNYPCGEPHNCNESRGDGEVKLACGCMLPVVAGALSPDGQFKLKQWQTQMVPCSRGSINGTKTIVMRDTAVSYTHLTLPTTPYV